MHSLAEELRRLLSFEERHRRLLSRLAIVFLVTSIMALIGSVAVYFLERHGPKTEVHSYGNALFFTTVQLLTVSSQLKNPVTAGGRVFDVFLELWAVVVVAGAGGAVAAFFLTDDAD